MDAEIKGQFKFFTTDKLGNIFVITPKNDIQKYNKTGKKLAEANFKVMGEATFIDASNPMEIYVFYRDQNRLAYFDNLLNYRGETDLYKTLGVNNVTVACRSYDNGFWFFDPDNFKLIKADKAGNLESESVNLANIADTVLSPQAILDDGRYVYLKTNSNRLLVFDILGNYEKSIRLEKFNTFQTKGENILYSTKNDLMIYNPGTFEKKSLFDDYPEFKSKTYLNIRFDDNSLYFQDSSKVSVFSF